MPVPFHELCDLLVGKRVPENPVPLLRDPFRVHFLMGRCGRPGPCPVDPARPERGEPRGFSEPDGLDGRVGLRVGVSEVEGNVRLERPGRGRVFLGALLGLLLLGFWGFGRGRKWRVVRVFG